MPALFSLKGFVLATALFAMATSPADASGFLKFSKVPALRATSTTVEVGTLFTPDRGRADWLKRTVRTGDSTTVDWTDTIRCPAAKAAIQEAASLTPPSIWIPDVPVRPDGSIAVVADGISYEIEAGAHYNGTVASQIRFGSNVDTPLAKWVERTLDRLRSCWSNERPIGDIYDSSPDAAPGD